MLSKILIISIALGCVFIWAQVIPNNEFSTNLESWYGMFDAWWSDTSNIGSLAWSSSYGGSAYMYVYGWPNVIGIWTQTRGPIPQGEQVYTRITHSNIAGFAGIFFTIGGEPPYGQQINHSDTAGTYDLSITADRIYPAGTPVWIKFSIWPGEAEAWIWNISTTASIEENNSKTATYLEKTASFPCPSKGNVRIFYELKRTSKVSIIIHDASGKSIRVVNEGLKTQGKYVFFWDGKDDHGVISPAGTYFYSINADGRILTNKVLILK